MKILRFVTLMILTICFATTAQALPKEPGNLWPAIEKITSAKKGLGEDKSTATRSKQNTKGKKKDVPSGQSDVIDPNCNIPVNVTPPSEGDGKNTDKTSDFVDNECDGTNVPVCTDVEVVFEITENYGSVMEKMAEFMHKVMSDITSDEENITVSCDEEKLNVLLEEIKNISTSIKYNGIFEATKDEMERKNVINKF